MRDILPQIISAMHSKGIVPTEELIADGQLHRFHVDGDNPAKRNGWAVISTGTIPTAFYGSWRTGEKHFWQSDKPFSVGEKLAAAAEQVKLRDKYQIDKKSKQAQAAETAKLLLNEARPADPEHPYLKSKKIQPHNAKQLEGVLLIPMYYGMEVVSLQAIYTDGSKRFLKGGRTKHSHHVISFNPDDAGGYNCMPIERVYVCEGFATGATIQEAYSGQNVTVLCAFTASNLIHVARDARNSCPDAKIMIAADNDINTADNPGLTAGRKAAAAARARMIYPDFDSLPASGTDFNDYVNAGGAL